MIQTERQLRKIIKENISKKILLKEFFEDMFGGSDSDDEGSDFFNNDNYNVTIDDEIIKDATETNAKRKNQLIIESILILADINSNLFRDFFAKSFKKQKIDNDFFSDQDNKRNLDKEKLTKIIAEWKKILNGTDKAIKDPAGAYRAANIVLKNKLDSFRPQWPVLWIFFRDAKDILRNIINENNGLNSNSNWQKEKIDNTSASIEVLNKTGHNTLKDALIKYFNQKLQITENDINEMGSELGDSEGLNEINSLIMTVLKFFFGPEIIPVAKEFQRAIKQSSSIQSTVTNNNNNQTSQKPENSQKQQSKEQLSTKKEKEVVEKIKNTKVAQKIIQGNGSDVNKFDLDKFLNLINDDGIE
jgi:hypothetical protein